MSTTIHIQGEYIELYRLLKLARIAETGGQGKDCIRDGRVTLNGAPVSELRKKIRPEDTVRI